MISPEVLSWIPDASYMDMTQLIQVALSKGVSVGTSLFSDYWKDLGNIQDYRQAQGDFLGGEYSLAPSIV